MASNKRKRSMPTGGAMGAFVDLTDTDDEDGSQGECEIVSFLPPKTPLASSKSGGRSVVANPRRGGAAAANDGNNDSDDDKCQLVSVSAPSGSSSARSARSFRGNSDNNATADFAASISQRGLGNNADTLSDAAAYAAALQQDEQRQAKESKRSIDDITNDDAAYAAALQEDELRQAKQSKRTNDDATYAAALQEDEQRQAKQSQRSMDDMADGDAAYAAALQEEERRQAKQVAAMSSDETTNDEAFALSIKDEEIQNHHETIRAEHAAMASTTSGKAWLFVQRILATHARLKSTTSSPEIDSQINTVAVDDMVYLSERLLDLQAAFREAGKPSHVDVAYHYTKSQSMERIRTDGLMTHAERQSNDVNATHNGSVFGDGIYTANNPFAFRHFGEVGLFVARMQGETSRGEIGGRGRHGEGGSDTVIGNKVSRFQGGLRPGQGGHNEYYDEIVLRNSSQCVPVIRFSSTLIAPNSDRSLGNELVHVYHREIQTIVDEFFNCGQKTTVSKVLPSSATANLSRPAIMPPGLGQGFNMLNSIPPPQVFPGWGQHSNRRNGASYNSRSMALPYNPEPKEVLSYVAPYVLNEPTCAFQDLADGAASSGECSICLDSLFRRPAGTNKAVSLKVCKHKFHLTCVKSALSHSNKCPICRMTVGEVQGKSPSGTMSITRSPVKCCGHEGCGGSILITYNLPGSVQRVYHDNPGARYAGATRMAYLPDNDEGKKLLERLKYAFMRGLTFVVGTSMTTGQHNCVTWGSIHHKSHPSGGLQAHGFPDDGYFVNCNEELDGLGVPPAEDCKEKGVVE